MMQHGAFRKTRGAGGVLDHHGIVGSDIRKFAGRRAGRIEELVPLVEADHIAQFGALRPDRLDGGEHGIAAELGGYHDARRL